MALEFGRILNPIRFARSSSLVLPVLLECGRLAINECGCGSAGAVALHDDTLASLVNDLGRTSACAHNGCSLRQT